MRRKAFASVCAAVAAFGISSLNAQQVTSGSVAHDTSGHPVFLHQHLTPPSQPSVPAVAVRRATTASVAAAAGPVVKVVPQPFVSKDPAKDCGPGFVSQSNGGQVQANWATGIGLPVSASNARQGLSFEAVEDP